MAESPTARLLALLAANWALLLAVGGLGWALYNKFGRGLAGVPGPRAAGYTQLWRLWAVYKGRFHEEQIRLHQRYGRLVRIAPHVVSVGDPAAIPTIYGLSHDFGKTAFYPIQCISWKKKPEMNVFSTRDPVEHRGEKRKITNAYSLSNLLQSEAKVDECTTLFMDRMRDWADAGRSVDLAAWLQYYAFDVIGEITFAKKLGFLEEGKDVDGIMHAIEGMLAYATLCGQVPEAHQALLGNPLLTKLAPAMESWDSVLIFTLKAINSRTSIKRDEELPESDEQGVDMLSRWNAVRSSDPLKMNTRDVIVHLSTNVFAGSDTMAIALRSVIYYLCRNPDKMTKVIEEIDAADREGKLSQPLSYKESTTNLTYFAAVLKEAMRLHPSVGLIMERHVPPRGAEICGQFIPGGTIVGINPWVLNYDAEIFENPTEFIPERWLDGDSEGARRREDVLMFNFGAGARSCIGKNISMMEMQKVLPQLLRTYSVELTHPEKDWSIQNHWFVQQSDMFCNLKKRF